MLAAAFAFAFSMTWYTGRYAVWPSLNIVTEDGIPDFADLDATWANAKFLGFITNVIGCVLFGLSSAAVLYKISNAAKLSSNANLAGTLKRMLIFVLIQLGALIGIVAVSSVLSNNP